MHRYKADSQDSFEEDELYFDAEAIPQQQTTMNTTRTAASSSSSPSRTPVKKVIKTTADGYREEVIEYDDGSIVKRRQKLGDAVETSPIHQQNISETGSFHSSHSPSPAVSSNKQPIAQSPNPDKTIVKKLIRTTPDGYSEEVIEYDDGSKMTRRRKLEPDAASASVHSHSTPSPIALSNQQPNVVVESSQSSPSRTTRSQQPPRLRDEASVVSDITEPAAGKNPVNKIIRTTPDGYREEVVEYDDGTTTIKRHKLGEDANDAQKASSKAPMKPIQSEPGKPEVKLVNDVLYITADGKSGTNGSSGYGGRDAPTMEAAGEAGGDATAPCEGGHATNIDINLGTEVRDDKVFGQIEVVARGSPSSQVLFEDVFPLESFPDIDWSARGGFGGDGAHGGNGGAGGEGMCGADASESFPAGNGRNGGPGGAGGEGTSGGDGGAGGLVRVFIKEQDSFLIGAIHGWDEKSVADRVAGGNGGRSGSHGYGGAGGRGGEGGRGYAPQSKGRRGVRMRHKEQQMAGGYAGVQGPGGFTPESTLVAGQPGRKGSFTICYTNSQTPRIGPGGFDLMLAHLAIKGDSELANSEYEIGTTVRVASLEVQNVGSLVMPAGTCVQISLDENLAAPYEPVQDAAKVIYSSETALEVKDTATSTDELSVFLRPPTIQHALDFDPLSITGYIAFKADLVGPPGCNVESHQFQRPMKHFQLDPMVCPVTAMFPLQNITGIEGPASLPPNETKEYHFSFTNHGLSDLGSATETGRKVSVRYRMEPGEHQTLTDDDLDFSLALQQYGSALDNPEVTGESLFEGGISINVPNIGKGDSMVAVFSLDLSQKATPYARADLVAELILDVASNPKGELNPEVIQRRSLNLVAEPWYETGEESHVVLVTSSSTLPTQYHSWLSVIGDLGLVAETYSLSLYGSLDPGYPLVDPITLKDAFSGKLIILLNDEFFVSQKSVQPVLPCDLLPYGCLQEISGYDATTNWLVAGGNEANLVDHARFIYLRPPASFRAFNALDPFKTFMKSARSSTRKLGYNEATLGDYQAYSFPFSPTGGKGGAFGKQDWGKQENLQQVCQSQSNWLFEKCPIRHFAVASDVQGGNVCIFEGPSKAQNQSLHVSGSYLHEPTQIQSPAMLFSVASALSWQVRAERYCAATAQSDPLVTQAYRTAIIANLVREARVLADVSTTMVNLDVQESEGIFPTIDSLMFNVDMLTLVRNAKVDVQLRERLTNELSSLIAQCRMVALAKLLPTHDPKDAKKRNSKFPRPLRGSSTNANVLQTEVDLLERQWRSVLDQSQITSLCQQLDLQVRSVYPSPLKASASDIMGSKLWLDALCFIHSTSNAQSFDGSGDLICRHLVDVASSPGSGRPWEAATGPSFAPVDLSSVYSFREGLEQKRQEMKYIIPSQEVVVEEEQVVEHEQVPA